MPISARRLSTGSLIVLDEIIRAIADGDDERVWAIIAADAARLDSQKRSDQAKRAWAKRREREAGR